MTVDMRPSLNLKDAMEQRRAVRAFRPDSIPEVILKEILRLGVSAPSGYNLQPWRFIVLREQESKEKLKARAFDQRQIGEAPIVLICCGDRRAGQSENVESVIQMGRDLGAINDANADYMRQAIPQLFEFHPCYENIEAWTNRHTMLAVAQLMIAAKSFGVDSCPMEGFIATQVKEAFNIPTEVDVCCLLCLGYATEPYKQYGGRFDIEQVCYGESYGQQFEL